jgi:hypothetical protein
MISYGTKKVLFLGTSSVKNLFFRVKGGQIRAYMEHNILRQLCPWEPIDPIDIAFTFDFVDEGFSLRIFTCQMIMEQKENMFSSQ